MDGPQPWDAVLDFWFGPAPLRRPEWFKADPAFDAAIRGQFMPLYERAAAGFLPDWEDKAEGALALCLLLDQFPRNMFRGSPKAFETDPRARAVARKAVAAGLDRKVDAMRRLFFYLPFEHSEDMADQEEGVRLMATLYDAEALRWAVAHRDIIARFGRFPHRNAILRRESTAEELEFLKQPGSSF